MLERHIKQSHDPNKEIKTSFKGGNFGLKHRKSLTDLNKGKTPSPSPRKKSEKNSPWKSSNKDENNKFDATIVADLPSNVTSKETLEEIFLEYTQFLGKVDQPKANDVVDKNNDMDKISESKRNVTEDKNKSIGSKSKQVEDLDKINGGGNKKLELDPVLVEQSAMDEPWYCIDCKREFQTNTNPYVHHMTVHANSNTESQASEPMQSVASSGEQEISPKGDKYTDLHSAAEGVNHKDDQKQELENSKRKYLKQGKGHNKTTSEHKNKSMSSKDAAGNTSWFCAPCDKTIHNIDPYQHHMTTHLSAGNHPSWFCVMCNKEIHNADPYLHNMSTHLVDPRLLLQSFLANQIMQSQQMLGLTNHANGALTSSPVENMKQSTSKGLKRKNKPLKPVESGDVSTSDNSDSMDSADVNHNVGGESHESPKNDEESSSESPKKKAKQFTYTTLCLP